MLSHSEMFLLPLNGTSGNSSSIAKKRKNRKRKNSTQTHTNITHMHNNYVYSSTHRYSSKALEVVVLVTLGVSVSFFRCLPIKRNAFFFFFGRYLI